MRIQTCSWRPLTSIEPLVEAARAYHKRDVCGDVISDVALQVVLAHTPFRRLAQHMPLRDKPVLVAGVGSPAEVARHYGFRQVLTLPQLHAAQPHSAPFAVREGEQQLPFFSRLYF